MDFKQLLKEPDCGRFDVNADQNQKQTSNFLKRRGEKHPELSA